MNKMGQVCVYCSYQDPNYQLGYRFSDYADDELVEKQGGGGPTPADFIPFIASFSLPLTAALITFVAIITVYIWELRIRNLLISPKARMRRSGDEGIVIIVFLKVSAAFLLFPETIEIDVDSRKKRSLEDNFLTAGMCGGSSSKICRVLEKFSCPS